MNFLSLLRSSYVVIPLIIAALFCLYPGLTEPIMSLRAGAYLPIVGQVELYQQTQSIWSGINSLYRSGYWLVAFLIFLFSVFVPLVKILALIVVLAFKQWRHRNAMHTLILVIGKWSMADVFVVGIFIAFLAGQANPNMQAELHAGFYWFLMYCILSILSTQLMRLSPYGTK